MKEKENEVDEDEEMEAEADRWDEAYAITRQRQMLELGDGDERQGR